MATEDLQLICAALKSNMAMVELGPSENLIAPGEEEAKRFQSHPIRTSHVIVNGEAEIVAQTSQANATFLDDMTRYWLEGLTGEDLYNKRLERETAVFADNKVLNERITSGTSGPILPQSTQSGHPNRGIGTALLFPDLFRPSKTAFYHTVIQWSLLLKKLLG